MISLYNRLQNAWRKNFRSTKPAADCGDGAEELEQAQPKTFGYNRDYRLSDAGRHRVRKFFVRVLAPINYRLESIWRKISCSIKRACDFTGACWRFAKKVLFRVLAPLLPIYHRFKIIWRKSWLFAKKAVHRALAPFAPLLHRLGIVWRKNWRGIK